MTILAYLLSLIACKFADIAFSLIYITLTAQIVSVFGVIYGALIVKKYKTSDYTSHAASFLRKFQAIIHFVGGYISGFMQVAIIGWVFHRFGFVPSKIFLFVLIGLNVFSQIVTPVSPYETLGNSAKIADLIGFSISAAVFWVSMTN